MDVENRFDKSVRMLREIKKDNAIVTLEVLKTRCAREYGIIDASAIRRIVNSLVSLGMIKYLPNGEIEILV